ncbi:MAG: NifB/NifX family molybdenum-iron cluster-binding protein [bacterium]
MKIAITTAGKTLDSPVDPRFGRAVGFIIYNSDTQEHKYIDNQQNMNAPQGAGIQAAKAVVDAGAEALITGHCGPKAFMALKSAGIKVFTGADGTVQEVIEKFNSGTLTETQGADVSGHWF